MNGMRAAARVVPRKKISHSLFAIYIFTFLITLQVALPAYVNSTFLGTFISGTYVGLLYAAASFLSIIVFNFGPRLLTRFGNFKIALSIIIAQVAILIGLAVLAVPALIIGLFIISFVITAFLTFNLDIFVEKYSTDHVTGNIRGVFMTTANAAWILSALITSFLLTNGDYWKIFIASSLLLIPSAWILYSNLRNFKDPEYHSVPFVKTFFEIVHSKDIRGIFYIGFLLQFFYALMVIYTPIYLHNVIGFEWSSLGIIFSIMLLPFVLIELPLGKLADSRWGEKEALAIGFIIMAGATTIMTFITTSNFLLWTAILFTTRVGASMVEIMSETYFFKKVSTRNANVISTYRAIRPLAYLLGPLFMTLILFIFPFKDIFLILGCILLTGLVACFNLEDTL